VLDTLSPPDRVAFVLHDLFALPFEDIGAIVRRSSAMRSVKPVFAECLRQSQIARHAERPW
jgi:DNA-directed RNA polymerase specialized sigma24 family protein